MEVNHYFGPDLFEVVDRRAKLVVNELSEEQSDSQLQGKEFKLWRLFACINQCAKLDLLSLYLQFHIHGYINGELVQ